jgi:hypothetical protein
MGKLLGKKSVEEKCERVKKLRVEICQSKGSKSKNGTGTSPGAGWRALSPSGEWLVASGG